ncbi:MAG: InlB B-repeat-containing protein [Acholeplasmatales bacterium]|jgi:hypothetical protein|nr:InlB B-repeat-containing protein [Acholeplasmatales bacterium]
MIFFNKYRKYVLKEFILLSLGLLIFLVSCKSVPIYEVKLSIDYENRGIITGEGFYNDNDLVNLIAYPNPGYKFIGWVDSNNDLVSTNEFYSFFISENINLKATYSISAFIINYVLFGGKNNPLNPRNFNVESENIILEPATKYGYSFHGWTIDVINKGTVGNVTTTALFLPNSFLILKVINSDIILEDTAYFDMLYTPETPVLVGRKFVGWFLDQNYNDRILFPIFPTSNFVIYAKFE